jgi:outer membrane protein assembly factor BamB
MILKQPRGVAVLGATLLLVACKAQGTPPVPLNQPSSTWQSVRENANGESVAYQINVQHTGYADAQLRRPLKQLWSIDLGTGYRGTVGYSVIANGIVVTTVSDKLVALDEKTGKKLWTQVSPSQGSGTNGWIGPAYDNGMIFVDPASPKSSNAPGMFAFDERTGKKLWSTFAGAPFTSPPTAASGIVYTSSNGKVYAFDETTGSLKWTASVENGDDSSPAVTQNGVYVSYACPQTYDFDPSNGKLLWHFAGPCEGGGGSTPVIYNGLLYVEDDGTLKAQSVPKMKSLWTAQISSSEGYATPPLVIGNIVYVATTANTLAGYDVANGKQKVDEDLGNGGYYHTYSAALAYGDGELIVPNGSYLIAFVGS